MKNNRGITLITLIITTIVLAIILGITVYSALDVVKRANLETLRSNMLLIQAKVKEYAEEADFKMGPNNDTSKKDEVYSSYYLKKTTEVSDVQIPSQFVGEDYYYISNEALNNMGLGTIEGKLKNNEYYLVRINEDEMNIEVFNTLGYQDHYSLSELDNLQ